MLRLATVNVVLHLLGLILAVLFMRPGTPAVALEERLAYLAQRSFGWTAAWSAWVACAFVMVTFGVAVAQRVRESAGWARLAIVILVVAVAFDLLGDSLYLLVLPQLAAGRPADPALFLAFERSTQIVSLLIANTLYSVGTFLLTLALRDRDDLITGTRAAGYGVFVFGILLSLGGVTGVPWHIEWTTGPTIGLYCVWVMLVARSLDRRGSSP